MASDFYLQIEGKAPIKGEASGEFKEWIPVIKFTIGANSPTDFDGQSGGRAQLEHVEFEFNSSIASPPLFSALLTNETLKKVTLTCRKTGPTGKLATYLQWRFTSARLVSYKMNGENEKVSDTITMAYATVEVWCGPQKQDGSVGPGTNTAYDASGNSMVKSTLPDPKPEDKKK